MLSRPLLSHRGPRIQRWPRIQRRPQNRGLPRPFTVGTSVILSPKDSLAISCLDYISIADEDKMDLLGGELHDLKYVFAELDRYTLSTQPEGIKNLGDLVADLVARSREKIPYPTHEDLKRRLKGLSNDLNTYFIQKYCVPAGDNSPLEKAEDRFNNRLTNGDRTINGLGDGSSKGVEVHDESTKEVKVNHTILSNIKRPTPCFCLGGRSSGNSMDLLHCRVGQPTSERRYDSGNIQEGPLPWYGEYKNHLWEAVSNRASSPDP